MSINPTSRRPKHPMDMGSLVFCTSKDWSIQTLNAEGKPVILGGTRRRTWTEIVNVAEGMNCLGLTFRIRGVPVVCVPLYIVKTVWCIHAMKLLCPQPTMIPIRKTKNDNFIRYRSTRLPSL